MTLAIDVATLALAAALFATPVLAQVTAPPPGMPTVPTTKVIAIGSVTAKWTPDAVRTVMPAEVRDTVLLYLAGKVDQWYVRRDRPGVVFILNMVDPVEAERLLDDLPLGREGLMTFEVIPLGPLAPLGLLTGGAMHLEKPGAQSTAADQEQQCGGVSGRCRPSRSTRPITGG